MSGRAFAAHGIITDFIGDQRADMRSHTMVAGQFLAGRGGFHVDPARLADDSGKRDTSVNVVFVVPGYGPSGRALARDALEAEPPPPRYDPVPPGQKLLSPPRPMFKNAWGVWEKVPEDK